MSLPRVVHDPFVLAAALLGTLVAGCATPPSADHVPPGPGEVNIDVVSVPLNPDAPAQVSIGDFLYAGGLELTSRQTNLLHGLSDLVVTGAGELIAVGDVGVLFEARLVLDEAERLVGLTDSRLTLLTGEDGKPLPGKEEADAEGLARLPGGDLLVSFERHHRILLYPAGGGPPRVVPSPEGDFAFNSGLEALSDDPEAGEDAYVVGVEDTGDTWTCRLASTCVSGPTVDKPGKAGLVAMTRLPEARTAYLLRTYDQKSGNRVRMEVHDATGLVAWMDMTRPMTVDNFEGLAAVPRTDGSIRFYLLSDDNGSPAQRTLLLAFDWRPR